MKLTALKDEVVIGEKEVRDLINVFSSEASSLKLSYTKYSGKVPILDRSFKDETLVNNKLPNDFRGEIIDQIIAYLVGKPVTYTYEDEENEKTLELLKYWRKRNNIHVVDIGLVKLMSCCGRAGRLFYLNDGNIMVINVEPWKYIPIWRDCEIIAVIYYYTVYDEKAETVIKAEVYDNTNVTVYQESENGYVICKETVAHGFDRVPFIEIDNNDEQLSDFEKVGALIDAYDSAVSDMQNEIEEHRIAYQVFENCKITPADKINARATGAYSVPKGGKISYLTKDLHGTYVKEHLDRMEENIYKFSKTVNMSDEKFSGNTQSGVSRKWKLLTLEFRATIKQLAFVQGLLKQFEIFEYIWNARGAKFEYLDMDYKFTRNIPMELTEAAETAGKLKGIVSNRTILEGMPQVSDVDAEIERLDEEGEFIDDLE